MIDTFSNNYQYENFIDYKLNLMSKEYMIFYILNKYYSHIVLSIVLDDLKKLINILNDKVININNIKQLVPEICEIMKTFNLNKNI